ncbi:MAG: 4Fe-4S dicluster domain-containing protein, partial [Actinobacteria bacterium]|nr:4Fe-4S dicluster domain-containing protein [Actinomycetota bacterium]
MNATTELIQQHLIDPEICIRCNTCEATCPVGAITHDSRNYVVNAEICNLCMACVPPCPTGSIDNWRAMPKASAYSVEEQLGWDELPAVLHDPASSASVPQTATAQQEVAASFVAADPAQAQAFASSSYGSTLPPWSAAHPYVNLHGPKSPITAKVVGNVQVNEAGTDNETHHIVLD